MSRNEPILSLHPLVRLFRLFLWLTFLFFLVFGSLALALRSEAIQTRIVHWLADKATERLGYRCSIGGFYLDWVDFARATNVQVLDKEGHPMIRVRELKINLKLMALLEKNINLDFVEISEGLVEVRRSTHSGKINFTGFSDAILDWINGGDTSRSLHPPVFSIDKVRLEAMTFGYVDETEASLPGQFDYYHFHLDGINGLVYNFRQCRDSIGLLAENLVAVDRASRLEVKSLSTAFDLNGKNMHFRDLQAQIGNSIVKDSLVFLYNNGWSDFSDFNHLVRLEVNLDSSVIHSTDLAYFAPSLHQWKDVYTASGRLSGTVDNIRWRKLDLCFGKETQMKGSLNMRGFPKLDETSTDLRIRSSRINPGDLSVYTGKAAAEYLGFLGIFQVSGSFQGYFRDFVTKSTFLTSLGRIEADMQMELPEDPKEQSRYQGHLKTVAFNLGRLLKQEGKVQKLDFDGSFRGRGFDPNSAEASVDARISRIGVLGYDYRNIVTNARFSRRSFDGQLAIKDPHLIFNGKGKIDLSKDVEIVDIDAVLGRVNFKPLHLTENALDISSEINLHFKGFDFDDFMGNARIRNLRVLYDTEYIDLEDASLESEIVNGEKTFSFRSEVADVKLKGSFQYRKLITDAMDMLSEYRRLILNEGMVNQEAFVAQRKKSAVSYGVEARLLIKHDMNKFLDVLDFPLSISPNTEIESEIRFGNSELVSLSTNIDTLRFRNQELYHTSLILNSTKTIERPDVIAELDFSSKAQRWGKRFQTENIDLNAVWDKGKINCRLKAKERNTENRAAINAEVTFEPFNTLVKLRNSSVQLFDKNWDFNSKNTIAFSDSGSVQFRDLELQNGIQHLAISGIYLGSPADSILVTASNIQLEELRSLTGEDLKGLINGKINIRHLPDNPLFEGYLDASGLVFRDYPVGDFQGHASWNPDQKNLGIDGNLLRDGKELLALSGFYSSDSVSPLNMRAKVQRLGIDFLQPLIGSSVSGMKGWAAGELMVKGDFSRPELTGTLNVKDGQVKINYLNTTYFFNPKVEFRPTEIMASGAVITDESGRSGILKQAVLRHRNFSDFFVGLNADLSNFMVFNIPKSAGEVYYGTGICTGNLEIYGGFDDISIQANAKTNKGTKLFIPLDEVSKEDLGESFISFRSVNSRNRIASKDSVRKINLSGIRMNFDLEVTEDAYGEIIFDQKAGDIIRANGSGKIKLGIDTRGDFSLIGQYTIKKGDYHFTTYNLVNKDFDIRPGSTITWNGPVLGGVMDILAEYNLNASLAPLATGDDQMQQRPEAKRRYPVLVSMKLTDQLLKPVISLGLDIRDYPRNSDLSNYVQAFLARIATDEQELNRQVFSLMIFRMFAPMGEFTQTAGISYSSFSDLVSNQLSSWLSQFDENLEVSVDLAGLSQADINNFQLRFSYTMLEGRLRLTRDGGFTNSQNQASPLSIAGDWSLEYMLSKNGVFRVKMFHRINQNLNFSGLNNTTQGASLLHTQSFNKISELFPARKKKVNPAPAAPRKPETNPESAATLPENRFKP